MPRHDDLSSVEHFLEKSGTTVLPEEPTISCFTIEEGTGCVVVFKIDSTSKLIVHDNIIIIFLPTTTIARKKDFANNINRSEGTPYYYVSHTYMLFAKDDTRVHLGRGHESSAHRVYPRVVC